MSKSNLLDYLKDYHYTDQLADRIGEIFDCPITIEDSHHRVLSYNQHSENIDEARINTIMNRKVPENVIANLWKTGIMPKLIESDEPVIIPRIDEVGLGNRVAVSIRKKNEILGFIWVHTKDKTLSEDELQLLKEVAKQVKKFFLKQRQRKRKSEEHYQYFIWKLLTEDIDDPTDFQIQANQSNLSLVGNLSIVVFRFSEEVTREMEKLSYYIAETLVQVQVVFRLFDEDEFILLVRHEKESSSSHQFISTFIEKVSSQLKLQNVDGAAGLIYESIKDIKDSYTQALRVLDLKESFPELKDTYLYEDLGVYQFIEELAKVRKGTNHQNKYISRLRSYDQKHQTSLLSTLGTYLRNDCNVYKAAQELYIHPNTMNYRLKRIKEVADLNLKDPNQKTTIYLDLIIENRFV